MTFKKNHQISTFPLTKSIFGKVGIVMIFISVISILLSISTYILNEKVTRDSTNTRQIELPNALISVYMIRYASEMNLNILFYSLGKHQSLNTYYHNKNQFNTSIEELERVQPLPSVKLDNIKNTFLLFTQEIEDKIIGKHDAPRETDAINMLKHIRNNQYNDLEFALNDFSRETSLHVFNSMTRLHNILDKNKHSLFALFGFLAISSILLTVFMYQKVTKPISRLADSMRKLANGTINIPIPYKNRPDEIGQISHAVSSFREHIISLNHAREQLMCKKDLAESASKTKAQFLAAMSHEIRTPMNGVIGMIDILRRSNLNATQMGLVATVRESALSLLTIINDILDFSRIEAGKMRIDNEPLCLRYIAEQVMDNLTSEANDKNVLLTLHVSPNVPSSLCGDAIRIKQILFNLVGNGIKFSSGQSYRGEVHVTISSTKQQHSTLIAIEIRDNGIGISQNKLQSIFCPFTQAEYATTRRYGGSGLGLAISQNIASLMAGEISVKSDEGIGSQFIVTFSLPETASANTPDDCNIDILTETAQTLNQNICIVTLENGALKSSIENYLAELRINFITIPLEQLAAKKLNLDEQKYIVICRDYLLTKQSMPVHATQHANIRYLELDINLPVHRYGAADVFAIYASPMKLSSLLSGLRICLGLESPDYHALDTYGKVEFIERNVIEGHTILVAEDNITNQTVIKKQLSYLGYRVVVTDDGQEALQEYKKQPFTLVLTDCHMPNMDGYQLTKAIRSIQKERNEFVPIIALTANALVGEAERCIETGMNDFIAKPVEIDVIQKVLCKWSALSKPYDRPSKIDITSTSFMTTLAKQNSQELPDAISTALDSDVLTRLFWGDKETYLEVLNTFEKHCIPELQGLSENRPPYNFKAIKEIAHKLKTSSRSIGAKTLSDICLKLEKAAIEKNNDLSPLFMQFDVEFTACAIAVHQKRETLTTELQQTHNDIVQHG